MEKWSKKKLIEWYVSVKTSAPASRHDDQFRQPNNNVTNQSIIPNDQIELNEESRASLVNQVSDTSNDISNEIINIPKDCFLLDDVIDYLIKYLNKIP